MKKFVSLVVVLLALTTMSMAQSHKSHHTKKHVVHHKHHVVHHHHKTVHH